MRENLNQNESISFKARSSGKLFQQNKPIRNFFVFSNAHYDPRNIYPMMLNALRADQKHKKRRKNRKVDYRNLAKGTGVPENDKWGSYLRRSQYNLGDTMNRSKKCACITNTSCDSTMTAPTIAQAQKLRAEDIEWWKAKDFQTLSAAGAMFSAQRAKRLMTAC